MHLEGQQSVLAALKARRRKIIVVFVKTGASSARILEVLAEAEAQAISVHHVSREELDNMAFGKSHGGVIVRCGRKPLDSMSDLDEILKRRSGFPLLLLLEGVEDVQHLGYVLRSAEALGVHAVLLKKHLWDFDETTLSRTSSGAFERMPLIKFSEVGQLDKLQKYDIQLWGCIARAKRVVYEVDLNRPIVLAVGGEKRGLSGKVRERCDGFLRIPMAPGSATSLSLTHAACLLLGEAARQRNFKDAGARHLSQKFDRE